jgi:uncharacterized protein (DUF779 family)
LGSSRSRLYDVTAPPPPRVVATAAALQAITRLEVARGPVIFFQSGGCCDGSLPICFLEGQLAIGDRDVLLGELGDSRFYIDHRQFEVMRHTRLVLDVAPGAPEGFSLPAGDDAHFVIRSRVFTDEEEVALAG